MFVALNNNNLRCLSELVEHTTDRESVRTGTKSCRSFGKCDSAKRTWSWIGLTTSNCSVIVRMFGLSPKFRRHKLLHGRRSKKECSSTDRKASIDNLVDVEIARRQCVRAFNVIVAARMSMLVFGLFWVRVNAKRGYGQSIKITYVSFQSVLVINYPHSGNRKLRPRTSG